ncbi:hypothetical protein Acid345_1051 [Candidatus Koribacter versatilis Ellin345]|uniref:Iron-containing redox enzyme family protein n=1 Tax=Koribacter versatilis (strain Ellin345) TaxID=204669 RepID=Q1ISU6_KORVE|nr:iron-containing redox enzyme family protein [Candidatus Koribacter versatilis]ABF40054.1 hypothetical protein Acid345_1051 [Candidatus Koribacter versatilis Ellin345]
MSQATHVAASNSSILSTKIALAHPRLDFSARRFWKHPDLHILLPKFYLELYAVVRGGLSVMEIAQRRAEELSANDPVAAILADYYAKHLVEERGHDEWLLEDMEHCGIDRQHAIERIPSGAVAALIGAQQFWVLQEHPVAFLGYVSVVEGNPPVQTHINEIRDATGYPDASFRSLREHADVDTGHAAELRGLIDSLPLSPRHHRLLGLSAFETVGGLARIFDQLCGE